MHKLYFFIAGLPTIWIVAESITLLPKTIESTLISLLTKLMPTYDKSIVTYVFNLSELLISFLVVGIFMLVLAKLFKAELIENRYFYLLGNISGYLFLLAMAYFITEHDSYGILLFSEKILFHIIGVSVAWRVVTQRAMKT